MELDDSFIGISNHRKTKKGTEYEFEYDTKPKKRWVTELDASLYPRLLNEYYRTINLREHNEELNICNTEKDTPCYNKKKTAGIIEYNTLID